MNRKKVLSNIAEVLFSKSATLASGIAVGFIVPKILGVDDYGYYRIYTLYTTYTALMHFGFCDGVLLEYAGLDYNKLPPKRMRTYTRFFLVFQLLICLIFCVASVFVLNANYRFIVTMLGINTFLNNSMTYYQFISQATQRFREYSVRNFIVAIAKIALVAIMFFTQVAWGINSTFRQYIIFLILLDAAILVWYIYTYKAITFGEGLKVSECKTDILMLFKKGIPLTLAYQVAHLVFALDRQFVSILFSTAIYSIYSFAYSMINLVSQMVASVATVLLPVLKRQKKDVLKQYYRPFLSIITLISGIALAGYFPLNAFVAWLLPAYVDSLQYLRIIFPTFILTNCISVVFFTFYKVEERNDIYLKSGCFALVFGFTLNLGAWLIFRSPVAISWASVITILVWYFIAGYHFSKEHLKEHIRSLIYICMLALIFYLISSCEISWYAGLLIYIVVFLPISIAMYRDRLTCLCK